MKMNFILMKTIYAKYGNIMRRHHSQHNMMINGLLL